MRHYLPSVPITDTVLGRFDRRLCQKQHIPFQLILRFILDAWLWFKLFFLVDGWGISCEITHRWMAVLLINKSALVRVIVWCRQATSHYLCQYRPRCMSSYGAIRPHNILNTPISSISESWEERPLTQGVIGRQFPSFDAPLRYISGGNLARLTSQDNQIHLYNPLIRPLPVVNWLPRVITRHTIKCLQ